MEDLMKKDNMKLNLDFDLYRSLSYKKFHKRPNDWKGRYTLVHFLENFPVILSFMKYRVFKTFFGRTSPR